jgi:hypothetical protein
MANTSTSRITIYVPATGLAGGAASFGAHCELPDEALEDPDFKAILETGGTLILSDRNAPGGNAFNINLRTMPWIKSVDCDFECGPEATGEWNGETGTWRGGKYRDHEPAYDVADLRKALKQGKSLQDLIAQATAPRPVSYPVPERRFEFEGDAYVAPKPGSPVLEAFIAKNFPADDPDEVFSKVYRSGGAILGGSMPDSLRAVELMHFSFWPSGEEYDPDEEDPVVAPYATGDEVDAADRLFGAPILREWARRHNLPQLRRIARAYAAGRLDQDATFRKVSQVFAKAGWIVYSSDTYWEGYVTDEHVHAAIEQLAKQSWRRFLPKLRDRALPASLN